jgi:non-ribosomal peptide synthetase component F/pimeloyl-ACP methyl ester carboxylesterase
MSEKRLANPALSEPAPASSADGNQQATDAGEVFVLPTSLGQERFWGLDRMKPGNPTWNVPVRFRLQGTLNTGHVEAAFNEIVRRHESLRTTFTVVDGQPAQVIKPHLKIVVPVTDLRHIPKSERDAEVDRLSVKEAHWHFDLAAGPLFRVNLLQVADDEHVLLVNPHHSVADYISIGLISNELGALYVAYSGGGEPVLPELPIQYGDFAVWQREQSQGPVVQSEVAYWKEQLKNLPLLEFPTDHPRPSLPTYNSTITSMLLPVKLTDAVRNIANREGATLFNALLAALAVVLHQHTGQTNFGVGTQVSGRTSVELEPMIGLFINNVVLRMDLSGDPSFPQLVGRVQEVAMQAIANQNLRFEQLLRELRPNDYPSHHTLFRINFICQRDPVKPLEFGGIKLTVIPSKSQGALYDLNVFLILRNEGWRLACEYNTDLFEAGTITRLLENYRAVLEKIVETSSSRISELSPAGRGLAPKSLGAAAVNQMVPSDVMAPVVAARCAKPPAESYVMPASAAQRRFWILERLTPGNPALHMRACVRLTGSVSVAALEKSLQALVHRHETLRTTFEGVDEDLVQVIAASRKISLSVVSIETTPSANREAELSESIRTEAAAAFDLGRGPLIRARLFRLGPQEHVLVITTHHILVDGWSQNVLQRELWTYYEAFAEANEPSLPSLDIQYADFVHWQREWLGSESAKQELDFWRKRLAPPLPLMSLPTGRPGRNRAASPAPMETLLLPEVLTRSLKSLSKSQDVSMFMVLLTGYSALLHRYTNQDDFVIGSPVANRRTETEPLIGPFAGPLLLRLNLKGNPTLRELLERVRDITLEALSHADMPFEELLKNLEVRSVRGRNPLSQCYFFYQTAFLQPRQLHNLIVTPMPDFGLGTHFELQMGLLDRREGVRAQLEYNPSLFEPVTIRCILDDYHKVLEVFSENPDLRISDLPASLQATRAPMATVDPSTVEVVPPRDDPERQLAEIWEETLQVRSVGVRQNFFDLGGNSLLAVRLFGQIEKTFGKRLPLSTLFEAQTVEDFAAILRDEDAAPDWSPLVAIQPKGTRPRFFCVHGGGGNVLIYRALSRHLGSDQPLYGLQSQGLDGQRPHLTRIEDMAALYVKEMRRVQPHGPYFLGGYCMGGTVAYEMAQQLKAQGEEVALLALFDTVNWSKVRSDALRTKAHFQMQRLIFHARNFLLLNLKDRIRFFKEKVVVLQHRSSVWRGMLLGKFMSERPGSESDSLLLARMWEVNDRAILTYVPRPYAGTLSDFRPVKQYAKYLGPDMNWDRLALGGQEILTLPVFPAGMLLEPFVKHLAAALRSSIDKVIEGAPEEANPPKVYVTTSE